MEKVHVCYTGTTIYFTGTKAECEAHRESLPYKTDSWRISDIEDFGDACYSDGYDNGYDSGYDSGACND